MAATIPDLEPYLGESLSENPVWEAMMAQYWPGALTLVLPTSSLLPLAMNLNQDQTLGVRIPACAIALEILQQTGPLATTSANRSGQSPLITMKAIAEVFPTVLTLDCGDQNDQPLGNGQPSTVAKWTGNNWQILRKGQVTL